MVGPVTNENGWRLQIISEGAHCGRAAGKPALLKCADLLSHLTIIIIKANLLPHVTALLLPQPSPPPIDFVAR
ncbi:hypothetical protein ALO83_200026 [Pseudomonas cannabina pv. alisalensis]|nr:hypothetical protein ALO83_200026 [Pseudomonas cannabina pv. alisalensis]